MSIDLPDKPAVFRFVGGPCDGEVVDIDHERSLPFLTGCPLTESEVHWVLTRGGALDTVIEKLSAASRRHLYRIVEKRESAREVVLICRYYGADQ